MLTKPPNRPATRFWFAIYGFTAVILTVAVMVFAWLASQSRKEAGEGRTASAPAPEGATVSQARYQALAQFAPPAYVPVMGPKHRGTEEFRQAMELYTNREYKQAIPPLQAISQKQPDFAEARYYLGICQLAAGDHSAGINELQAVIALGTTPYLEGARFYLAKGLLGSGDVVGARREFEQAIALDGDFKQLAQVLLSEIGPSR